MPEQLVKDLIDGPIQRRRDVWRRLTARGQLRHLCSERLEERTAKAATLLEKTCRHVLANAKGSLPEFLIKEFALSSNEARRLVDQFLLLLATATLTARLRLGETDFAALTYWACISTGLAVDSIPEMPPPQIRSTTDDTLAQRIGSLFDELRGTAIAKGRVDQLAAARFAVLNYLGLSKPAHRVANVPILTVLRRDRQANEGRVLYLSLALLENGHGAVFPRPDMFRVFDQDWWRTLNEVAERECSSLGFCDVCWEIDFSPSSTTSRHSRRRSSYYAATSLVDDGSDSFAPLGGSSAQAALQVALRLLREKGLYDIRCAISAGVAADETLTQVEGVVADHGSAGPKLVAARKELRRGQVLVAPNDFDTLSEAARERLTPLQVRKAVRLDDVYAEVSGKTHAACAYLANLAATLERKDAFRYVEPDVEQATAELTVRVPWTTTIQDLGRGPVPLHALVLGTPGQGKTTLARRTIAATAMASRQQLSSGHSLDAICWPVLVAAADLTAAWAAAPFLPSLTRFGAALSDVLAADLRCCPGADPSTAGELVERLIPAGTNCRSLGLLILDALDEVPAAHRDHVGDLLEAARELRCHIVATSRPYAVENRLRAEGWNVYTLAPFSDQQVQQYFRVCCGREPPTEVLSGRLGQEINRTPFLLELLARCLAGVGEEVLARRTDLFRQVVLSMLAEALGASGDAEAWLPVLGELAAHGLEDLLERGTSLSRERVVAHLRRLHPTGQSGSGGAERALEILERSRLFCPLDPSRTAFGFSHRLILEYLAAVGLAREIHIYDTAWLLGRAWSHYHGKSPWQRLDRKCWDPRWEELILFLAEMQPATAGRLGANFARRARDDSFGHRLSLAVRCLAAGAVPDLIRASGQLFLLWWHHAQRGTTAVVERVAEALPAAARLGAVAEGQAVGVWLREKLADSELRARRSAVECIGLLEGEAERLGLLLPLVEQLVERPLEMGVAVAAALRRLGRSAGTASVLERLADLLVDSRNEVQQAAIVAVQALGPAAGAPIFLDRLRLLLNADDGPGLLAAIRAATFLAEAGTGLLEMLRRQLGDRTLEVQEAALQSIANLSPFHRTESVLLNQLTRCLNADKYIPTIRRGAIHALRAAGQSAARERTLKRLLKLLDDPEKEVRQASATALRDIGLSPAWRRRVLHVLAKRLGVSLSGNRRRRRRQRTSKKQWVQAAEAAGFLGPVVAHPQLIRALVDGLRRAPRRRTAARTLEAIGPDVAGHCLRWLKRFLSLLTDKDQEVRRSAILTAGRYIIAAGDPGSIRESLDGAQKALAGEDPAKRAAAARALLRHRLAQLLQGHDPLHLKVAADLIGALGAPRGSLRLSRELLQLLDNSCPEVVQAGWQAVAARGDWRDEPDRRGQFFDRLTRHLSQRFQSLHGSAISAMERLAPDPLRTDVVAACCRLLETSPDSEVRAGAARVLREWMRLGIRILPASGPFRWLPVWSGTTVRTVQGLSQVNS